MTVSDRQGAGEGRRCLVHGVAGGSRGVAVAGDAGAAAAAPAAVVDAPAAGWPRATDTMATSAPIAATLRRGPRARLCAVVPSYPPLVPPEATCR